MPRCTDLGDFTTNNLPNYGGRIAQGYRASNAVNTYLPGTILQLVAVNSQILPDFQTVAPSAAAASGTKIAGVVAPDWGGFDGFGVNPASFVSPASQLNARGTSFINAVVKGIAYVFVDTSAGVTITDGIPLQTSANTAGYAQGVATSTALNGSCLVGVANLPSSGIGSSLTGAALAQATQTWTIAGTPVAGDVIGVTIQAPYTDLQPGVVQTHQVLTTLTSTTAATVTTAAAAVVAACNADPVFSLYMTFANVAGVITATINTAAAAFLVTGGTTTVSGNSQEQWRFNTHISGMVANSLTTTAQYTQAAGSSGTNTAGGGTFTGGTGYKGKVPALIYGMY